MADATGNQRDRAILWMLWCSGLRVSTFSALNYGDISEELEKGEAYVRIPVFSGMKTRVPDACKGRIPYYTFICPEATEALTCYLRYRREQFGPVREHDPLFYSNWTLWSREKRSTKRLGRRAIGHIVKQSARLAGVEQWQYVTPHCLRKAFESVLRSPTMDGGRMDRGTQQFLFGHILPGSEDTYYDKTSVDFHRSEYAKLDFSQNQAFMTLVKDKLIDLHDLEEHLNGGWLFVAKISENKTIVRRTS